MNEIEQESSTNMNQTRRSRPLDSLYENGKLKDIDAVLERASSSRIAISADTINNIAAESRKIRASSQVTSEHLSMEFSD